MTPTQPTFSPLVASMLSHKPEFAYIAFGRLALDQVFRIRG
jgi:hypothetical protein